jgi:predicted RNase H-like HicB family nuclease
VGLPGVMAYGATKAEAVGTTLQLALEVLEDMAEHGEAPVTTTFAVELAPAAAA